MSIRGGLSLTAKRRAEKLSFGNDVAKNLLWRLCLEDLYGEKFLNVIEKAGLLGPRIEHLYNAVWRDDTIFVRFVYIIAATQDRERILSMKYLDEYINLVEELRPIYEYHFPDKK